MPCSCCFRIDRSFCHRYRCRRVRAQSRRWYNRRHGSRRTQGVGSARSGGARSARAVRRDPAAHGGAGGRRPVPDGGGVARRRASSRLPPLHPRLPPVHAAPVRDAGVLGPPVERRPRRPCLRDGGGVRAPVRRLARRGARRGLAVRSVGALLVAGDHRRGLHVERAAVLRRLRARAARRAARASRIERPASEPGEGLAGARAPARWPSPASRAQDDRDAGLAGKPRDRFAGTRHP